MNTTYEHLYVKQDLSLHSGLSEEEYKSWTRAEFLEKSTLLDRFLENITKVEERLRKLTTTSYLSLPRIVVVCAMAFSSICHEKCETWYMNTCSHRAPFRSRKRNFYPPARRIQQSLSLRMPLTWLTSRSRITSRGRSYSNSGTKRTTFDSTTIVSFPDSCIGIYGD
jgi:hypothetical protein